MAGSNDFTGQNIQDTYQRVLQLSSSGQLADGTGSLVPLLDVTASFAVSASHEITKEVTSSYAETASAAEHDFNIAGNLNFDGTLPEITANGTSMMTLQPSANQIISPSSIRLDDTKELRFGTNIDYKLKHNASETLTILEGNSTRFTFGVGGHLTASSGVNVKLNSGQFVSTTLGANLVHVTSSIVSASEHIQTNTLKGGGDDVSLHVIGSITASGDISASGTIVASNLSGINTGDQNLSPYLLSANTASFVINSQTGSFLTSLPAGLLSGSAQIATEITGAFFAASSSFSSRVTTNDGKVGYTDAAVKIKLDTENVISSSAQIADVTLTTAAQTNITSVGALTGGSIESGFGSINVGGNSITTTGTVTAGPIVATSDISTLSFISASGDIGSSGTVVGVTGSFGRGNFDDVLLAQNIIKLNTNNNFLQGKETGGTSRNILGINSSDVIQVANANLKTDIKGTNIFLDAPVTASTHISASGDIYGQTIYGLQFEQFSSNFTFNFDGTNTDTVFMPISDQSTAEHASSATNINVSRTSIVKGRPIKTTMRSTSNTGTKDIQVTCSVFYNEIGLGSAGAGPGDINAGQKRLVTAQTLVPALNHRAVELDFTTDNTGSVQDVPAGSRFYITMVARGNGDTTAADLPNTTFIVSNLWRWDYSDL